MNYVLFSAVGKSDPINKGYDGPLTHIVRRYCPEKVYLFYTKEMKKYKHAINYALKYISPNCEIENIISDIENAFDFDAFSSSFNELLKMVKEKNPGSRVLVNVSSGTPQIKTTLGLLSVTFGNITPIQVTDPDHESGRKETPFDPEKDSIENEMEVNLDSLDDAHDRCLEPGFVFFRKTLLEAQILRLIKSYDYHGAYKLFMDEYILSDKLKSLLEHAFNRISYDSEKAEKIARETGLEHILYPIKETRPKVACEYFNITKIRSLNEEITDTLLRIKPLAEYLAHDFIDRTMKSGRVFTKKYTGSRIFLADDADISFPGITEYLNDKYTKYDDGFRKAQELSLKSYIYIAAFISKDREPEIINRFTELSSLIEGRNVAAHSLARPEVSSISITKAISNLSWLIIRVYGNSIKSVIFDIYDKLNRLIAEEISY